MVQCIKLELALSLIVMVRVAGWAPMHAAMTAAPAPAETRRIKFLSKFTYISPAVSSAAPKTPALSPSWFRTMGVWHLSLKTNFTASCAPPV